MKTKYLKRVSPIHACLPRSPLEDGRKIVAVQQNRSKWQCKPVCKLYVREAYGGKTKTYNKHLLKILMSRGLSLQEAIDALEKQNL